MKGNKVTGLALDLSNKNKKDIVLSSDSLANDLSSSVLLMLIHDPY